MRLTIACPEVLISDANHLAMVLGYSVFDKLTYGLPQWVDTFDNKYSVASLPVSQDFFNNAFALLQRPEWDGDYKVSMAAAKRAQAAVRLFDPDNSLKASPDYILAYPGEDALLSCSEMGLTRIPEESI